MVDHIPRNRITHKQHRVSDVKLSSIETAEEHSSNDEVYVHTTRSFNIYEHKSSAGSKFIRSVILLFLVLALIIFLGAFLFARAQVKITPHTLTGSVDTVIDFGDEEAGHSYETMTLTREKIQKVLVEDFQIQETRASGTIVIFNEETKEQHLREETRFETPEGLIFLLGKGEGITIPAAEGGTPGSVEAVVYAQSPGDTYAIGPSDFVIPGWREINDSRFATQYARSKGPMESGGSGPTPVISEELRTKITQEMQRSLREQMIAQAWVDAPDEFILFEDIIDISFSPLTLTGIKGDDMSATASMTGELSTVLFHHDEVATLFAQEISDTYDNESIRIDNPSSLKATLSPQSRSLLGWETGNGLEEKNIYEQKKSDTDNTD